MMLGAMIFVGIGGALGAMGRFALGVWMTSLGMGAGFPVAVLCANVFGSFVMGAMVVLLSRYDANAWQPFIMTGVLGGFTTFSAFSLEAFTLYERGQPTAAFAYVALSLCGALAALALGVTIARGVLN